MSYSEIFSGASLIVSIISFFLALCSYCIAKKSLNINKQQHDERYLEVDLYYIEAYKWEKDEKKYVSFALRFTNNSTLSTTIPKIELHIEYHDENNLIGKIKLKPEGQIAPINLKDYSEVITIPVNLPDKTAKIGWITFKLPTLQEKQIIDIYQVVAETIDNKNISIDTHIINEV